MTLNKRTNIFQCGVITTMLLCGGCRISNMGKDQPSEASKQGEDANAAVSRPVVQPQQQQGSYSQIIPVTLGDDGKVKEKLTLRLDYFAPSKPGGVTVPSCYESLSAHLVVGRLVCAVNPELTSDVQAKQLDQVCHTDKASPTLVAASAPILGGCKGGATLQVYKFEPQIKVDSQVAP